MPRAGSFPCGRIIMAFTRPQSPTGSELAGALSRPLPRAVKARRSRGSMLGGDAQSDPKTASLARLRFDSHATSHPFRDFANDRQANAGAFVLVRKALKHVKNPFPVLLRNPNPIVDNPNSNRMIEFLGLNTHAGTNSGRNEFDRVPE